jgi:hypothetical protein
MIHQTMKAAAHLFKLSVFIILLLLFQFLAQNPTTLAIKSRANLYYPRSVEYKLTMIYLNLDCID